jgi:uncharacterized protein (TIGR02596 family)
MNRFPFLLVRARRAYTLVELMTVMAIMAILLAVTVPAIQGLNQSTNIAQGGQLFTDQVALARQLASARNLTVEVRCIKMPSHSANGYTGIQLWSPATSLPISRVVMLPDGIAISQDTTKLSSLFNTYCPTPGTMPAGGITSNDSYVSFTVSPSGMVGPLTTTTTEPNMTTLTIGIVTVGNATVTSLPSNYALIQVNPLTAATVTYRP